MGVKKKNCTKFRNLPGKSGELAGRQMANVYIEYTVSKLLQMKTFQAPNIKHACYVFSVCLNWAMSKLAKLRKLWGLSGILREHSAISTDFPVFAQPDARISIKLVQLSHLCCCVPWQLVGSGLSLCAFLHQCTAVNVTWAFRMRSENFGTDILSYFLFTTVLARPFERCMAVPVDWEDCSKFRSLQGKSRELAGTLTSNSFRTDWWGKLLFQDKLAPQRQWVFPFYHTILQPSKSCTFQCNTKNNPLSKQSTNFWTE